MEKLLDFLTTYGWAGFIIILIIYSVYFLLFKENIFTSEEKSAESDLRYHPFFRYSQYRHSVEIPHLVLCPDTPVKQRVFIDLLLILNENLIKVCEEIADIEDMDEWSPIKWGSEVSRLTVNALNDWETESIKNDIPLVVLIKFNNWAANSFSMMHEYITVLADSKIYTNNKTRTSTFFLVMNLLMVALIGDAERTMRDLNGDIAGQSYKGQIIEH